MSVPEKLGRYEIRRELGSGAMATVYEGWDPSIKRRVAVKTIKRDTLDSAEAEEIIARFQREAQAAGQLSHPNIVSIYEYGEDAGVAFIAMEFIAGRELKDYFDKHEVFPLAEIVRIMTQLLGALGAAHRAGIIHRDVKPSNIILLADGTVKVADFGIARIDSSSLTQVGIILGTPSYMSPEQFTGQTLDGRTDLFSAGVILYQFLTGEKPFAAAQASTIMHKVLNEDPPPPSKINIQVPHAFDALMRKALAKRADERFQSAQEFADALREAAANRYAEAPAPMAAEGDDAGKDLTMVTSRRAIAAPVPASASSNAREAKSKLPLVVGGVVVILVAAIGAAKLIASLLPAAPSSQPASAPRVKEPVAAAPESSVAAFDPVRALDQVFEGRDRNHPVTVIVDKSRMKIGRDPLRFKVGTPKPGYVYVLMVGTDRGNFNLLFPNAVDEDNRIGKDQELTLPRAGWAITAAGPPGTDHLVAIVSENPRSFAEAGLRKVDPFGEFPLDTAARVSRSQPGNPAPFAGKPVCKPESPCSAAYGAATFSIEETN